MCTVTHIVGQWVNVEYLRAALDAVCYAMFSAIPKMLRRSDECITSKGVDVTSSEWCIYIVDLIKTGEYLPVPKGYKHLPLIIALVLVNDVFHLTSKRLDEQLPRLL